MKATESSRVVSTLRTENPQLNTTMQSQRHEASRQQLEPAFEESFVMAGLPARKNLSDALAKAHSEDGQAAVLVIKAGGLAQINHSKGYEAGDEVIRELVSRISTRHPDVKFVGRLGGGHFLAIARHHQQEDSFADIMEQMIADLSLPIVISDGAVYVSCSIGASVTPEDTMIPDELLCNAELALRNAIQGGYGFYLPGLKERVSDRVAVRSALAGAMEREEFYLVYQPQICQRTGSVFGVEALLRWESESLGLVPPGRFIPIAEAAGLMPQIGHWVLKRACEQSRCWLDAGTPIRVAVNVSAAQLETGDFVEHVWKALVQHQLPPHLLEIEVTESMLVGQVQDNRTTLSAIRKLGVKLGLDDFGTGYSNLAYLRNFTFDTLKIDRLFTSALTERHPTDILIRAIIAIGDELGHEVIAEGIETEAQKDALLNLGCTRMQGFLFGRPVLPSELDVVGFKSA